ncbi:hypothetical protein BCR35DRAFT_178607 [Leucosporidium creatinivorum]|uniref:Glycosyltransferase family 31 protein n=1 Tax=Leucosporidium creatinivorum TaxID=106004 RepID=A0A1Y2E9J7_9BASI|nr:hypothetical protein BCR35DRAFT_178607 [Leucosporidium creatinivorum]
MRNMLPFLKKKDPLPWRSPHLPPSSYDGSGFPFSNLPEAASALIPLLRSRLVAALALGSFTIFILLSYLAGIPVPLLSSASTGSFPSHGLKRELWADLSQISLRHFVLQPREIQWTTPSSMDQPVPWTVDPLLPRRSSNLASAAHRGIADLPGGLVANGEHVPHHQIEVYPRVPLLHDGQTFPRGRDLIYGITTTVKRAKEMSELWTRWMVPVVEGDEDNRPGCMVLLSRDEDPLEIEELKKVLKGRGLNCGLRTSTHERYEVRVLSMTRELKDYAEELGRNFDWYIFNDDDTFWLDQLTVRRMLGKYDTTQKWFVGATTEAKNQLDQFGRMAFGGAGMLVSDPLMTEMYNVWDSCHEQFKHIFGGDEMVTRCAALAKGATKQTVTTEEKGLHQFDIPGDSTGVLQSGIPFINLHHYLGGTWVHLFGYGTYRTDFSQIQLLQRVVEFLGGDNMFKRYVFGDGKWLLVNGYSITFFEEPLTKNMMDKMVSSISG